MQLNKLLDDFLIVVMFFEEEKLQMILLYNVIFVINLSNDALRIGSCFLSQPN